MLTLNTRPPTKTQFVRFLDDNPPVDHPLYPAYQRGAARMGHYAATKGRQFGHYLYDRFKREFDALWQQLMQQPERWAKVKEGR